MTDTPMDISSSPSELAFNHVQKTIVLELQRERDTLESRARAVIHKEWEIECSNRAALKRNDDVRAREALRLVETASKKIQNLECDVGRAGDALPDLEISKDSAARFTAALEVIGKFLSGLHGRIEMRLNAPFEPNPLPPGLEAYLDGLPEPPIVGGTAVGGDSANEAEDEERSSSRIKRKKAKTDTKGVNQKNEEAPARKSDEAIKKEVKEAKEAKEKEAKEAKEAKDAKEVREKEAKDAKEMMRKLSAQNNTAAHDQQSTLEQGGGATSNGKGDGLPSGSEKDNNNNSKETYLLQYDFDGDELNRKVSNRFRAAVESKSCKRIRSSFGDSENPVFPARIAASVTCGPPERGSGRLPTCCLCGSQVRRDDYKGKAYKVETDIPCQVHCYHPHCLAYLNAVCKSTCIAPMMGVSSPCNMTERYR